MKLFFISEKHLTKVVWRFSQDKVLFQNLVLCVLADHFSSKFKGRLEGVGDPMQLLHLVDTNLFLFSNQHCNQRKSCSC